MAWDANASREASPAAGAANTAFAAPANSESAGTLKRTGSFDSAAIAGMQAAKTNSTAINRWKDMRPPGLISETTFVKRLRATPGMSTAASPSFRVVWLLPTRWSQHSCRSAAPSLAIPELTCPGAFVFVRHSSLFCFPCFRVPLVFSTYNVSDARPPCAGSCYDGGHEAPPFRNPRRDFAGSVRDDCGDVCLELLVGGFGGMGRSVVFGDGLHIQGPLPRGNSPAIH